MLRALSHDGNRRRSSRTPDQGPRSFGIRVSFRGSRHSGDPAARDDPLDRLVRCQIVDVHAGSRKSLVEAVALLEASLQPVGIWQFTGIWNEFLFAVSLTNSPDSHPVTVSLQNLAGSFAAQYNVQLAGRLIAAVPTLLVYILLGRTFVRGLLAGSLKG